MFHMLGADTNPSDQMDAFQLIMLWLQDFHVPDQNHDSYLNVI